MRLHCSPGASRSNKDGIALRQVKSPAPPEITTMAGESIHIASRFLPLSVECAFGIVALIGVRSEIIALRLDEIGWHPRAAIGVEVTERPHQRRRRDAPLRRRAHDGAKVFLPRHDGLPEGEIQQQVRQVRFRLIGCADQLQQLGANDAAASPDACDAFQFQIVSVGWEAFRNWAMP